MLERMRIMARELDETRQLWADPIQDERVPLDKEMVKFLAQLCAQKVQHSGVPWPSKINQVQEGGHGCVGPGPVLPPIFKPGQPQSNGIAGHVETNTILVHEDDSTVESNPIPMDQ